MSGIARPPTESSDIAAGGVLALAAAVAVGGRAATARGRLVHRGRLRPTHAAAQAEDPGPGLHDRRLAAVRGDRRRPAGGGPPPARDTVQWAVEKLKAAYFTKDPAEILDIWLFKDKTSYEKHCKSIFHNTPDTPFGYYSHEDGRW